MSKQIVIAAIGAVTTLAAAAISAWTAVHIQAVNRALGGDQAKSPTVTVSVPANDPTQPPSTSAPAPPASPTPTEAQSVLAFKVVPYGWPPNPAFQTGADGSSRWTFPLIPKQGKTTGGMYTELEAPSSVRQLKASLSYRAEGCPQDALWRITSLANNGVIANGSFTRNAGEAAVDVPLNATKFMLQVEFDASDPAVAAACTKTSLLVVFPPALR